MASDPQIFLPGDTISFVVELEHDVNLADAWADFWRRQEEGEVSGRVPIRLNVNVIEEVRRSGTDILSRLGFRAVVTKIDHLPGVYELETVRFLTTGQKRSDRLPGLEVADVPGVSFRIAREPDEPDLGVAYWVLGPLDQGQRDVEYERERQRRRDLD